MIGLSLPKSDDLSEWQKAFYQGVYKYIEDLDSDVEIIGGDLTGSLQHKMVSVTAIGECLAQPLYRSGAKPGMKVCVSGEFGLSNQGLKICQQSVINNLPLEASQDFVDAYLRPSLD